MEKYGMSRDEVIEKVILERQPSRKFATVEQLASTAAFYAPRPPSKLPAPPSAWMAAGRQCDQLAAFAARAAAA